MSAARNLTPWKPGQSGNPSGRPKLPEELRSIRALTQEELQRIISKYGRMPLPELDAIIAAKAGPTLELVVARILQEAFKRGDGQRLEFLLNRALGKPKEAPAADPIDEAILQIQEMSNQELAEFVRAKLPDLEGPA